MSIEIIGMVGTQEVSESRGSLDGPQIDPGYLTRFARAHEAAGFDRVLIGYGATGADGFAVAAHVLYAHLGAQGADRPPAGVRRPHPGGAQAGHPGPAHRRRPGRHPPHHRRRRAGPAAGRRLRRPRPALRAARPSSCACCAASSPRPEPFDFSGEFYRVAGAYSAVRPPAGGIRTAVLRRRSAAAVGVGAAHADVYMLWGEPRAQIAERIAAIRAEAARHGRSIRFSLSVRPDRGRRPRRRPGRGPRRSGRPPPGGRPRPRRRRRRAAGCSASACRPRSGRRGSRSRAPSATCTTSGCGTGSPG